MLLILELQKHLLPNVFLFSTNIGLKFMLDRSESQILTLQQSSERKKPFKSVFLNRGGASINFKGWREPLRTLQHGKIDQLIYE